MKLRSKIIFSLALILVAGFLLAVLGQTKIKTANAATCRGELFWKWPDGRDYTIPPGDLAVGDNLFGIFKVYDCQGSFVNISVFRDSTEILFSSKDITDAFFQIAVPINTGSEGKYHLSLKVPNVSSPLDSPSVTVIKKSCDVKVNFDVNPKNPTSLDQQLQLGGTIIITSGLCTQFNGAVMFLAQINGTGSFINVAQSDFRTLFGANTREATTTTTLRKVGIISDQGQRVTFKMRVVGQVFYGLPSLNITEDRDAVSSGVDVCINGCTSVNQTPPSGTGNQGVQGTNYNFELTPPIAIPSFVELINAIGRWIFNLSIPLAVIIIIYAGIKLLMSRGEPAEVTKAKNILKYAIWGLVVIFIGKGFISLVKSILQLGSP